MNENSTVLIPLDKGQSAIVSASQAHLVRGISWHAVWNSKSATYYASAKIKDHRSAAKRKYRVVLMHRLLTGVLDDATLIVHHRDGNGLNNIINNLHSCTLHEHAIFYQRHGPRDKTPPHVKNGFIPKLKRITTSDVASHKALWPATIPYGYCCCGCGQKTEIARRTLRSRNLIIGEPNPYLFRHNMPPSSRKGKEIVHPGIHPFKFLDGSPKYKVNEENGCWDWLGGLDSTGSGITTYGHKKRDRAYVVSWMLHNKQSSVPRGTVIHHICERRICVNPLHLQATTQAANIRASARKLSQSDADAIRAIYAEGKLKMHEIAIAYNIHPAHVSRVVAGKLWESSFASIPSVQDKAVRRRVLKNNKTGFKGVSVKRGRHDWSPIRYVAQVQSSLNGKRILERVGTFHTAIEAARAYDNRVYELFGDRAWLNFPNRPQSRIR